MITHILITGLTFLNNLAFHELILTFLNSLALFLLSSCTVGNLQNFVLVVVSCDAL